MKTNLDNKKGGVIKYLALFLVFIVIVTTFSIDVADIVESDFVQLAIAGTKRAWVDYWHPGLLFAWDSVLEPLWNWTLEILPATTNGEGSEVVTSAIPTTTDILTTN